MNEIQRNELREKYYNEITLSNHADENYDRLFDWFSKNMPEDWISSIESEREYQETALRKIWPNYPNDSPKFQYLNGLLHLAESYFNSENKQEAKTNEWVDANIRTPKFYGYYLGFTRDKDRRVAYFDGVFHSDDYGQQVTHWAALLDHPIIK